MCGLAGFVGFSDNVSLAKEANKTQAHRGPDNQSIWEDETIALAHQRLSIIDLSDSANQPFVKNNFVIVFNGEIYNYKELQSLLINEKEAVFISSSDTEVILEMYIHYGLKVLEHLVGMFAFAIYNVSERSLFIARDHFGIKPLFYTTIGESFAFSSELKTLVRIPGFNKSINSKSLVSCLNYLWVSGNETMFIDCYKLPPAHYLTYSENDGIKIIRYWELDDKLKLAEGSRLINDVVNTIGSSVKRHMVADVPVSSFLSGGLDSSLIAVLAKPLTSKLSTFTISTTEKDKKIERMPDDEKYANLVASLHQLDHHVIQISPNILTSLPNIVRSLDEPIGDPAAINTYLICQAARQNGAKVLLSGMGADEIYFGYRRQKATLLAIRYNRLPNVVKNLILKVVRKMPVRFFGKGFKIGRWSKRFLTFAALPVDEAYMRSYSYYDTQELKMLLKEDYVSAIDKLRLEHKTLFFSKYNSDPVNQMCNTDLHLFMLGLNLTYTDRASMAASVEVRVPFIDKVVVTEAMQIPGHLKIKDGISKYILKKAAENILPKEIIYRPKAAFGAPIRSWISNDLRGMVDELLSEASIIKRGFLNYAFVKDLIEKDRNGKEDYAYQIYQLLTLEIWCREYLD
ncbi:asparagine synthase (glutamine-hydrolyzing) [Segetibacter aerophilus]|uniref:asparagine synthase (glutamine-hydrolyzing) n=1 Tax=Segetibacter aerophilus TaxID=670293 RepID=A0A512BGZ3_9BACT|nr:asparagine synthase (glutamine-hydrolyzing) [Segetibacter aerophilus]GEO11242.1 asparagine synthetase B [Segetibacter aerophilus]